MIKIGITGQSGFVGQHLYNTIRLFPEEFELVEYHRSFFEDQERLNNFVSNCDVIVHLAAMNRDPDPQIIYDTNVVLIDKLYKALVFTNSKAHILFSSSSQEEKDNLYGKSKKRGRELLANWAAQGPGKFTGLIIPNVFGPFGQPYYNSFIATFCHQLTHFEQPEIQVDGEVKLIYVADLVKVMISEIRNCSGRDLFPVCHSEERKVSEILSLLEKYKTQYFDAGIIPALNGQFDLDLFNTFRSYIDVKNKFPVKFIQHTDVRGTFVEVIRLNVGGQVSFSTTVPGVTRGNHYHTRKIERFAVIKGKALIQLRKIGSTEIFDFYLDGNEPAYVDMPVWYTHNIKNIGDDELYTNFWINEFFDPTDPDTYFENV
ncbi:UDP-2-acetamido-2,6-beta-L-arabino-hexul-4-ose reductase [Pedobacter steynii]|uniref:UDP-2-acetamido-2,6-beta-L-arabino-hexul-4-ose reductase n=1 Tax=Pedobacter steynii TaxID=430522 RepID=A0A1G9WJR4_9SPHI|nr:NAD-dependent epimerase/dehydratase family protein [Pedobacter steynii]NQX40312.1 SDR family oxidoreductase [Pedobacter steynii]SDM84483.1 UDP-2-acetamido-2,6-beta-L-arabino-hexul-4-ose reductase [Pedobacter steynii]